jgi:hypothetical protein
MMDEIIEYILMASWLIFGWVNTSFSFASGAIIFYLIQVENKKREFSIKYFSILAIISIVGGHYIFSLIPHVVQDEYIDAIPAVNFMLGLFAKLILDIVLTKKFVEGKIK